MNTLMFADFAVYALINVVRSTDRQL